MGFVCIIVFILSTGRPFPFKVIGRDGRRHETPKSLGSSRTSAGNCTSDPSEKGGLGYLKGIPVPFPVLSSGIPSESPAK